MREIGACVSGDKCKKPLSTDDAELGLYVRVAEVLLQFHLITINIAGKTLVSHTHSSMHVGPCV